MEELLNTMTVSDIFIGGFILGIIFNMINDVILSLIDYLKEKAWRVNDYEKIISRYVGKYDGEDNEEKEIILNAHIEYEKILKKRKNLDKLLSKFRKNKNEQ